MKTYKPQYPPFIDLASLRVWHQNRAVLYRDQAKRMGNTAATTEEICHRGRQEGLTRKAQMHESAVSIIHAAESLLAAALATEDS